MLICRGKFYVFKDFHPNPFLVHGYILKNKENGPYECLRCYQFIVTIPRNEFKSDIMKEFQSADNFYDIAIHFNNSIIGACIYLSEFFCCIKDKKQEHKVRFIFNFDLGTAEQSHSFHNERGPCPDFKNKILEIEKENHRATRKP